MKRAWRVSFNGAEGIVAATSRGKAHARAFASALEVFNKPQWKNIKTRRAPEHDEWAALDETGTLWGEEFLPGGRYASARRGV